MSIETVVAPGAQAAEAPRPARMPVVRFLYLLGQLGLLAVAIRQFQVESSAFLRICLLAFGGFAVHAVLPVAFRLPFFVLLSLGGIVLVTGPVLGAALVGAGVLLIALCHLPIPFLARVGILLAVGGGLAAARVGVVDLPWFSAIWPVLAAMFMFRLIVYLYDLRHDKAPVSVWRSLAYFFLLPNICFPLFPVVDFKTFRRTYYDKEAFRIYQVGVNWMVLGVAHLLLYRVIYQRLAPAPAEVASPGQLLTYLATNFLLYLRVSGQFHIIIGMLHLFGFNLPESNNRYCLSSSFTDFWRRINIYWKDFMMKVFYYPAYFKLKKRGETKAIVLATLYVFAVTWLLHSYQWFWLRGSFPVVWQDGIFWSALAALVIVTSLYEMKHGRKRTLGTSQGTLKSAVVLALKTLGTFLAITVLWSLWTADSWGGWTSLWSVLPGFLSLRWIAILLGIVAAATGVAWIGRKLPSRGPVAAYGTPVLLVLMVLLGLPPVYERLSTDAASFVVLLKSNKLSRRDREALERGYYEDLLQVNRFNSQLWEVYMNRPLSWLDVQATGLIRFTGDFAQRELAPSLVSVDSFSTARTNRWGMRDKDYEQKPAPDTFRMALLGASCAMGWGVEDGETYETLVEDWLNRDYAGKGYARFEILNCAVAGYYPLQQAVAVEKAMPFEPRVVLYEATGREFWRAVFYLSDVNHKGIAIPYPELQAIADKAGLKHGMSQDEGEKRLTPFQSDILRWLYGHVVGRIRAKGALPVWIFVPQTYGGPTIEQEQALAEAAGFTVLDLRNAFKGPPHEEIRLAEWDSHPNARGHKMLAEDLYKKIRAKEEVFGLKR